MNQELLQSLVRVLIGNAIYINPIAINNNISSIQQSQHLSDVDRIATEVLRRIASHPKN